VNELINDVPTREGPVDLVTPSNIFDWLEHAEAGACLSDVAGRLLDPGGYLLLRLSFSAADIVRNAPSLRICDVIPPRVLADLDKSQMFYKNEAGFAARRRTDG